MQAIRNSPKGNARRQIATAYHEAGHIVAGFLAQTARPVTISNLEANDVEIRLFGDVAIIHARTSYTMADGRPGAGRYTDVWACQNGKWLCVSAHVTRG